MDETAPAASFALDNNESLSSSAPSDPFHVLRHQRRELSALCRRIPNEIGITSNGGSAALLEEPLVIVVREERSRGLVTLGTSARGDSAWPHHPDLAEDDGEDAPNLGVLPPTERLLSGEASGFRFASSSTTPPLEPEALPEWALQQEASYDWTS